jgi:IS30 family transposase
MLADSIQSLWAISQLYHALPTGAFKTGTTDRGKEFACHGKI